MAKTLRTIHLEAMRSQFRGILSSLESGVRTGEFQRDTTEDSKEKYRVWIAELDDLIDELYPDDLGRS